MFALAFSSKDCRYSSETGPKPDTGGSSEDEPLELELEDTSESESKSGSELLSLLALEDKSSTGFAREGDTVGDVFADDIVFVVEKGGGDMREALAMSVAVDSAKT